MMSKSEPKLNRLKELCASVGMAYAKLKDEEEPKNINLTFLIIGIFIFQDENIENFISDLKNKTFESQINIFEENLGVNLAPNIEYDEDCLKIFDFAEKIAETAKSRYVLLEHLFYALISYEDEVFSLKTSLEANYQVPPDVFEKAKSNFQDALIGDAVGEITFSEQPQGIRHITFCENLTIEAMSEKYPATFSDESKITDVSNILTRKSKKNVLLVGKPGTGKTTLVKALAYKIGIGESAEFLVGKMIFSVDLNAIVSGSKLRGQFEEKLEYVIKTAAKHENQVILFIDEIHTLIGSGASEGGSDAANILKPYLSDGRITVIGATTEDELSRIQKDKALKRRFSIVKIEEPTVKQTIDILNSAISSYEAYHHVKFMPGAVEEIVSLTSKYVSDNANPDKSFDLLDFAAAYCKNSAIKRPDSIKKTEEKLDKIAKKSDSEEMYFSLGSKYIERHRKQMEIWNLKKEKFQVKVSAEDVKKAFSEKTGIPISNVVLSSKDKMDSATVFLKSRILGQDETIDRVLEACARLFLGFSSTKRPLGSMVLYGEQNCGKSFLVKTLSECPAIGMNKNLITLDMEAFSSDTSVMSFIGSPTGYIGHDSVIPAVQPIKIAGNGIILLKNLDRACHGVLNIIKQGLESGAFKDNHGDDISLRNFLIFATVSSSKIKPSGFGAIEILPDIHSVFKHSVLKDFDAVSTFNPLTSDTKMRIINSLLDREFSEYYKNDINVNYKTLASYINSICESEPISKFTEKFLKREVYPKLNKLLIEGGTKSVNIEVKEKGLIFNVSEQDSRRFVCTPAISKA